MAKRRWRDIQGVRWVLDVFDDFMKHDDMALAAAVAFYTAFSFAPLVLLLVTVGGFLGQSTQHSLINVFEEQFGPRASEVTEAVVKSAQRDRHEAGSGPWIFSIVLLLISASAVFGQLQTSLNIIWEVPPRKGSGVWLWVRKRLLSLGMVLAGLFILLVSLVLSSIVEHIMPSGEGTAGRIWALAGSFLVSTLLFGAIFRVLPDAPVKWRQVWRGALITGALFSLGKFLLAMYLEHSEMAESYGKAAGAMVALLVWVYYSCIILFAGAEMVRLRTGPAEEADLSLAEPADGKNHEPPRGHAGARE